MMDLADAFAILISFAFIGTLAAVMVYAMRFLGVG
jgi:hypothetical protein